MLKDFLIERNEDEGIQKEFLDMIHDSTLKASFEDENLEKLWEMMEKAYPKVVEKTLFLTGFLSIYLCESAFSSVVAVKTKARNRLLDRDSDLRCAIPKIAPSISSSVDKTRENISLTVSHKC